MTKVSIIEASMTTTCTDMEGNEHEYLVFAGSSRDGAHVTIFENGPKSEHSWKGPMKFEAGDGDFENPLVSALWDLMGVTM